MANPVYVYRSKNNIFDSRLYEGLNIEAHFDVLRIHPSFTFRTLEADVIVRKGKPYPFADDSYLFPLAHFLLEATTQFMIHVVALNAI